MEEYKCPFNQPLRSAAFGCVQGLAVTRRDGPDVCCTSATAQARCTTLFDRLKQAALTALGMADDPLQVPHSIIVKVQFGGLLGLQHRLGVASSAPDRVADIHTLVEQAVNAFGSVDDVPCSDLAAHITAYKAKRRRDR